MPHKIGIKVWSTNKDLFPEIKKLYEEKVIQFAEIGIKSEDSIAELLPVPISFHFILGNVHFITVGSQIFTENMPDMELDELLTKGCRVLDLSKAITAAKRTGVDYKTYIKTAIKVIKPEYFHLSGTDPDTEVDEHLDLDEKIDWKYIKSILPKDCFLLFETPVGNFKKNLEYWSKL
jgi:hypothetical protein